MPKVTDLINIRDGVETQKVQPTVRTCNPYNTYYFIIWKENNKAVTSTSNPPQSSTNNSKNNRTEKVSINSKQNLGHHCRLSSVLPKYALTFGHLFIFLKTMVLPTCTPKPRKLLRIPNPSSILTFPRVQPLYFVSSSSSVWTWLSMYFREFQFPEQVDNYKIMGSLFLLDGGQVWEYRGMSPSMPMPIEN